MRVLLLLGALMLAGCTSVPSGPKFVAAAPLAEGLSRIYVFRPHFDDQAYHLEEPVLALNGVPLAAFPVGTYLELDLKPGRHDFELVPPSKRRTHWASTFSVDLQPGETRYVSFWVSTTVDRSFGRSMYLGLVFGMSAMFDNSNFISPTGLRLDLMSAEDAEPMLRQCHPAVSAPD